MTTNERLNEILIFQLNIYLNIYENLSFNVVILILSICSKSHICQICEKSNYNSYPDYNQVSYFVKYITAYGFYDSFNAYFNSNLIL